MGGCSWSLAMAEPASMGFGKSIPYLSPWYVGTHGLKILSTQAFKETNILVGKAGSYTS